MLDVKRGQRFFESLQATFLDTRDRKACACTHGIYRSAIVLPSRR